MRKPYSIKIQIQGLPKMINAGGRAHWTMKVREAKLWRSSVVWMIGSKRPPVPLKRARIKYKRVSAAQCDSDNLAISFKHVQDGLVDARVIEDDKYENIGMPEYSWEKAPPKKGYIEIEIEEILPIQELTSPSKSEHEG